VLVVSLRPTTIHRFYDACRVLPRDDGPLDETGRERPGPRAPSRLPRNPPVGRQDSASSSIVDRHYPYEGGNDPRWPLWGQ
jgi:hypothetical protein